MFGFLCRGKIWDDVMPGNLLNINNILAIKKNSAERKLNFHGGNSTFFSHFCHVCHPISSNIAILPVCVCTFEM